MADENPRSAPLDAARRALLPIAVGVVSGSVGFLLFRFGGDVDPGAWLRAPFGPAACLAAAIYFLAPPVRRGAAAAIGLAIGTYAAWFCALRTALFLFDSTQWGVLRPALVVLDGFESSFARSGLAAGCVGSLGLFVTLAAITPTLRSAWSAAALAICGTLAGLSLVLIDDYPAGMGQTLGTWALLAIWQATMLVVISVRSRTI